MHIIHRHMHSINILYAHTIMVELCAYGVIPSQFHNFSHMTISELDETWYTTSIYRFVLPDKVSPSFTIWLPGYDQ